MSFESFEKLPKEKKTVILKSGVAEFSQKSYADVSTDKITKNCGISKGLLFHYFGSKKEFYLYCLNQSLEKLVAATPEPEQSDFYGIIFSVMDEKFRLCHEYPDEMRLVNMAARESGGEIVDSKNKIFTEYLAKTTEASAKVMTRAVNTLQLKTPGEKKVIETLMLFVNVIMNKYLLIYREKPDKFFEQSDVIKAEMKEYINLMLYGVATEEKNEKDRFTESHDAMLSIQENK